MTGYISAPGSLHWYWTNRQQKGSYNVTHSYLCMLEHISVLEKLWSYKLNVNSIVLYGDFVSVVNWRRPAIFIS